MNSIADTGHNRELAASVNARMKADARIVSAKAAAWRLGGIGLLAFLLCCGVALLLVAYAKAQDTTQAADKIALALQKALAEITVKTEGSVQLDPNAKVALSDGAIVTMKEPAFVTLRDDSVVRLDARAAARDLAPRAPRELANDLGSEGGSGSNADVNRRIKTMEGEGKKVVSNFTKFFEVPWEGRLVTTGWVYKSSEDNAPSSQFCYTMTNDSDGNQIRVPLAENNVLRSNIKARGFSPSEAAKICFWHDGTKTRSY